MSRRLRETVGAALAVSLTAALAAQPAGQPVVRAGDAVLAVPTASQTAWEDDELGMFFHFDIEVFDPYYQVSHPRGTHGPPIGSIPPSAFNPARLDTDQWLQVAQSLGARYAVFTAKHDSGFLMWQSDVYPYGVRQSPWRGGRGDIVRNFIASCRKADIEPGLYCSAGDNSYWRIQHGLPPRGRLPSDPAIRQSLADTDLRLYADLWREAGPLRYIWFDGGVNFFGDRLIPVIGQLEPGAVCFNGPMAGVPGGLARWSGNEKGYINYPSWNTTDDPNDQTDRGPGSPGGRFWIPVEGNVPLRYHIWMWQRDDEDRILSLGTLVNDYLLTVGHGGNFIVNANIDPDGLVPEADARRFAEFGNFLRRSFGRSLAETSGQGDMLELDLAAPRPIDCVEIMEDIAQGQRIRDYVVEGRSGGVWRELCAGQSVGHKRIQAFPRATVDAVRLRVSDSAAPPVIRRLAAYDVDFPSRDNVNPAGTWAY